MRVNLLQQYRRRTLKCENGGHALNGVCLCGPEHVGQFCELKRCPNDCSGHGTCGTAADGVCECLDGFKGDSCSEVDAVTSMEK